MEIFWKSLASQPKEIKDPRPISNLYDEIIASKAVVDPSNQGLLLYKSRPLGKSFKKVKLDSDIENDSESHIQIMRFLCNGM